ncbi:TetR/AcrR family transcriptional regulator [Undibacterium terreum]|uniref:TetR family transcriptional regulator n=1 Tax=Undibacterium terreum TaxID=1224302 RepID=A0A916UFW2_9BURK|nr:TetR/AcrR family transcriptional regulator [Undibacterium terreum]GGC70931.1 TetR family transcriptional regulator [Undibacterium terreum]
MSITGQKIWNPKRATDRRKQVLDAAESCFGMKGFHGASMADISKAAGMSAGHIYNYFASKDEIIAAFVQQNVERVSAIVRDLHQQDDPLQAIYDDLEKSIHEDLQVGYWKLPLEIYAEASRNPKIAALAQAADRHSSNEFLSILKKGRQKRGMQVDELALAGQVEAMIAFFQGLQVRAMLNPQLDEAALVEAMKSAMYVLLFDE